MKTLIVEDNAEDRKILTYNLERHGCETIEAVDGQDGLKKAIIHKPELIISDALMPNMDGFQLLRAVKKNDALRNVPFIFYSAIYTVLPGGGTRPFPGRRCLVTSPPVCGNGIREGGEQCDGADLGGATCASQNCAAGTPTCSSSCTLSYASCTQCQVCGNGVREGSEQCDGSDLGGATCASRNCSGGTPTCSSSCGLSYASCTGCQVCGNNVREGAEVCDGSDLGGRTCQSEGFAGGILACRSSCTGVDTSLCTSDPNTILARIASGSDDAEESATGSVGLILLCARRHERPEEGASLHSHPGARVCAPVPVLRPRDRDVWQRDASPALRASRPSRQGPGGVASAHAQAAPLSEPEPAPVERHPASPAEASPARHPEGEQPTTAPGAVQPRGSTYWADFRGPGRLGHYDQAPILTTWPAGGLKRLWKQPSGGGYASFTVAHGVAFTMEQRRDNEVRVAAYDLMTGRARWTSAWSARGAG